MIGYQIYLTHACNLRCPRCGVWKSAPEAELSPESWTKLIPKLVAVFERVFKRKPAFKLLGGEPTIYPGFAEVVREIKSAGSGVAVLSNVVQDHQLDLLQSTLGPTDYVFVSMDSLPNRTALSPSTSVKDLAAHHLILRQDEFRFRVAVNLTVTKHSLVGLAALLEFLRERSVPVNVCLRQGGIKDALVHTFRAEDEAGNLTLQSEVETVVRLCRSLPPGLLLGSADYLGMLLEHGVNGNWKCARQPSLPYLYLDSDGSVMVCPDVVPRERIKFHPEWLNPFVEVERMLKQYRRICAGCTFTSAYSKVVEDLWDAPTEKTPD